MAAATVTINWSEIDTLLLDMDGTVLDLAFDNYFWLELVPQRFAHARGMAYEAALEEFRAHNERALGTLNWYCIDHWSDQLGLDIATIKHDVRHRIAYLPGALPFLRAARDFGLRPIVVTNAHRRTLAIKMRQTHLERHVDAVYSSHDFGHPKESAQFWRRFESSAGLRRERCVLIDDSRPVIAAGRAHGLGGTVTITQPDSSRPRRTVDDGPAVAGLADLAEVLGARRLSCLSREVSGAAGAVCRPRTRTRS
ncbi:MAG TPA: GMP/IMP nucleotidase [Gammaproteobacteria bacterium]|nr:GMP/IMP nucleotidase [Gammaproteobacteria bacterium]